MKNRNSTKTVRRIGACAACMVVMGLSVAVSLGQGAKPSPTPHSLLAPAPTPTPTPTPKPTPVPLPPNVEKFVVRTSSPDNSEAPFYVKWPSSYVPGQSKGPYRVLFICPCYNQDGMQVLSQQSPFFDLAEKRSWFVVIPTFKNNGDVHDRKVCYYYPEKFSGKAVCDALDLIKRKYPISTDGLLMQGYSGGAQFVHRFAIWAPERVAAVAVNSSTWLDAPNLGSCQVAWLVTIGESDPGYDPSLTFVEQLRKTGAPPIFRSYIGLEHLGADGGGVRQITCAFLSFYDDLTKAKLGKPRPLLGTKSQPPMSVSAMPFVGDMQDWKYQKNSSEALDDIPEDSRIYLPSEEVATVWNKEF